ncbi:transglutaminase-like domain-containing protein [Algicella marina]|uniref:Transglutaminase family protein n=1 Tax=Algicella marina TaxID=2683284 RepID=A0A6P1T5A1_9RHOB|nr:transglutaminase family protein [Algicella marina]QHQ36853.1 transglutaminase family protein [Algicella marina]
MLIRVGFEIEIDSSAPVPMLLALSIHSRQAGRQFGEDCVRTGDHASGHVYLDRFENRITRIVAPGGPLRLWSDCVIESDGQPDIQNPSARQMAVQDLPDDVVSYLVPSRYCDSDNLLNAAWSHFGQYPEGWQRVQAITEFVHNHVVFGYQFGRSNKTASEVYKERSGVCRDFAHLAIAFCRAMNIPARYASGYLGDIGVPYSGPGDFCAWFEVYLEGRWYTFDARYNTPRIGRVLMVRGADAADVAMITSFGDHSLRHFVVWCDELDPTLSESAVHQLLQSRPKAEALVYSTSARVA